LVSRTSLAGAVLFFLGAWVASPALAQNCADLYNPNQVLTMHITIDPVVWNTVRNSCPGGYCGSRPHVYYPATLRCGSGTAIQVGIRRKNGLAVPSESDPQKIPLKIDIDEFVPEQRFHGKAKLSLENGQDDSLLSEGLSWLLFQKAQVIAPKAAWVNVYVNGALKGLYVNVEDIDKEFLRDRGIDDGGFLFKVEDQRTRENETSPFAFNWYPFDHPHTPAEVAQPTDWRSQALTRVNMPHLLSVAAVENFVANSDAMVQKMTNYWYYDWSIFPSGQQRRLYLPWDYDTTMRPGETARPILGLGGGHLREGILLDTTFQPQYYSTYGSLVSGPLSLGQTLALVNGLEPVLTPHWNADPFQQMGPAAGEFQAIRSWLQTRTSFVLTQLGTCPDGTCSAGENRCSCPADCGQPPASEGICSNGFDDDCDGALDCSDTDCGANAVCATPLSNRVIINELLANTSGGPDVEFIEVFNAGPAAQDLTGWYVLDDDNLHDKCFLEGTLDPGSYLVVPGFRDLFMTEFPEAGNVNANQFDSTTAGRGFALSDSADSVRLFRPSPQGDVFVHGFTYGPQGADLAFGCIPDNADAPEYLAFPTPGATDSLSRVHSPICINELFTTSQAGGVDDWVEIFNRGTSSVDISGWKLSDTVSSPSKYSLPAGTIVPAGARIVVTEVQLGFSFTSTGSEVVLLTHADGVTGQDYFDYGPQFPDVSQGRVPDGRSSWHFMSPASPHVANACTAPELAPVPGPTFSSRTTLVWGSVSGAQAYDIVRGSLSMLRLTGGDFTSSVTGCQVNNAGTTQWSVAEVPAVGEGVFYLVRAVNASCGLGTYDTSSPSQVGTRDGEIAAGEDSCP
jgi:CotH kinase protein/Lamin Tail Domain